MVLLVCVIAVLHLLYARFMQHFLTSEGLVDACEPFSRLVMLGQVKSDSYRIKTSGAYLAPDQVDFSGQCKASVSVY